MLSSAKDTARSAPTGDSNVSGAPSGIDTGPSRSSTAQRARRTAVRPTSRAARSPLMGLRMNVGRASVISCARDGSRAGIQGGQGSVTALPSGVRSSSLASISAPATPSTTEWCTLAISPTMPLGHPLDDVHLPGRLSRRERTAHDLGHLGPEFGIATRSRERDAVQMVGQVELGVVHPARMVQSQRNGHEPAPERLQRRDARPEHGRHALEAVAAGERRGIEEARVGDLHRCLRCVGVDEHRIDAGHPLHMRFSTW